MLRFDANASARLRPSARQAAISALSEHCERGANPSSIHRAGREARAGLRRARSSLLELLGLAQGNIGRIVFCSGGTEACNLMLNGFLPAFLPPGANIVCGAHEHQAVLEPLRAAGELGYELRLLKPDLNGRLEPTAIGEACDEQTEVVCIMAANNVTGALQDVAAAAALLRSEGISAAIVCDATQALGKANFDAASLFAAGVDALAISGHKIGAMSGVGALVLRMDGDGCRMFKPLLLGGPQEQRFRAGTENLAGILSFGAAAKELTETGECERSRVSAARELLWELIHADVPEAQRITPAADAALSNTLAIRLPGVRGDDFVAALDLAGLAASTGSACSSGRQEASHVFTEMGMPQTQAREALRLSLDWDVEEADVRKGAKILVGCLQRMRDASNDIADNYQPAAG